MVLLRLQKSQKLNQKPLWNKMASLIPSIQNSILISKTVYQIYSIYTSLFQYNSQNRTFKTLGNVNPTKLKAWFEEVTVCLSRRAWRTPPVGAGDTLASVTHTRLCLTSIRKEPHFPLSCAAQSLLTGVQPRGQPPAPPLPFGLHAPASCLSHVPAPQPSRTPCISQCSACKRPLPG